MSCPRAPHNLIHWASLALVSLGLLVLGADTQAQGVTPVAQGSSPGAASAPTRTLNQLPNTAGQVWREYDLAPYTEQVKSVENPEQAVLDWVLRETGTRLWFTDPLGILHVGKGKLYVYHTPEIQAKVKGIVDRFLRTRGQVQTVGLGLVTIGSPDWRTQAYPLLQPITVSSPGIEAWLVSKENAAILMGQLRQRSDFQQHGNGRVNQHDGQSMVINRTQPVQFMRSLRWLPQQAPGYQQLLTTLNEGYQLQLSCLTTLDNRSIEAVIKCNVDQVERLTDVRVDVPSPAGPQPLNLQIPQLVSWRIHERFRWPSDQILVLSCGVVANPDPDARTDGFRIPLLQSSNDRVDALMFIEYRGPTTGATPDRTAAGAPLGRIGQPK